MRLDDIPISDPARDKAWEKFIKRKDVKAYFQTEPKFKFPLERGWYELWCQAWERAYNQAIKDTIKKTPGHF
jgi:hypothetical protein